nr:hypothetical protein [Pseudomonadota bacterium]
MNGYLTTLPLGLVVQSLGNSGALFSRPSWACGGLEGNGLTNCSDRAFGPVPAGACRPAGTAWVTPEL